MTAMRSIKTSTEWRVATVQQVRVEAPGVRTYMFSFDDPVQHVSGQHYEVRLTAEDGYQAARLYSAASPAGGNSKMLQLTVALMPYGEVSPYLFRNAKVGTQFEIRGPLGRYFAWMPEQTEPILLIGGGTGIIPLRAIWHEHMMAQAKSKIALMYSAGTYSDVIYKYELFPSNEAMPSDVFITFTEQAPRGWSGHRGRIDAGMIDELLKRVGGQPTCYVCGPTPFVEAASRLLVDAHVPEANIRAERFGPTGL